jgi:hypothetical protein
VHRAAASGATRQEGVRPGDGDHRAPRLILYDLYTTMHTVHTTMYTFPL